MNGQENSTRLVQSASALGAGLLGFGIGAKWGFKIDSSILLIVLVLGAIIHIAGMYVVQMKDAATAGTIARVLWATAWLPISLNWFVYLHFLKLTL